MTLAILADHKVSLARLARAVKATVVHRVAHEDVEAEETEGAAEAEAEGGQTEEAEMLGKTTPEIPNNHSGRGVTAGHTESEVREMKVIVKTMIDRLEVREIHEILVRIRMRENTHNKGDKIM